MIPIQPGILAPVPPVARYLTFEIAGGGGVADALARLRATADGETMVVGVGRSLALALGREQQLDRAAAVHQVAAVRAAQPAPQRTAGRRNLVTRTGT